MPIVLPKAPVGATRKSPKILVLYGMPKCGKTTILSKLPDCCILDVEDGAGYVEALKVTIKNVAEFNMFCNEVIQAGRPYKYIALDTVTTFELWMEQEATDEYKRSTIGKNFTGSSVLHLPEGGGYYWLRQTFQRYLYKLYTCAPRIILVAHVKDKYISSGNRAEDLKVPDKSKAVKLDIAVSTTDLDLTGKIRNITCAEADAIGYMYRNQEGKLFVNFNNGGAVTSGARPEHLKGQNFELDDWKKIYVD